MNLEEQNFIVVWTLLQEARKVCYERFYWHKHADTTLYMYRGTCVRTLIFMDLISYITVWHV